MATANGKSCCCAAPERCDAERHELHSNAERWNDSQNNLMPYSLCRKFSTTLLPSVRFSAPCSK
ncbi:hypothetical protein EZZ79_14550 [Pseudomonas syringae]|nr:hypothetical protein EZZ79_14550 [Pseudomonas syringae]